MLLAAFIIGAAAGGEMNVPVVLLLLCGVFGLWARHLAGEGWGRLPAVGRWFLVAVAAAVLFLGALIVFGFGRRLLLLPGVVIAGAAALAFVLERRRSGRTMAVSLLNALALGGILPAATIAASGKITALTAGLWMLCLLFFFSSIIRVRFRTRRCSSALLVAFHLAALGAAGVLWRLGIVPPLAAGALLPAAAAALILARRAGGRATTIRRIGLAELAHTAAFVALCVAASRGGMG